MSVLPRESPYPIASEKITQAFLGKPAFTDRESILTGDNPCSFVPVIDKYSITQILGRGGSGTVWKAEQLRPVKRPVAIKFLHAEALTASQLSRFENEQQTLARLNHPQIAKALDGGRTSHGVPYLVMELIDGIPLTEFCDNACCTVRTRLEIFRKVFAAVEHAHQRGIIHRDLKPTNVLVAVEDGRPSPKVIDFGLAKTVSRLNLAGNKADHATLPGTALGTPAYMSPEQVECNSSEVDTRTDVYSLGVMLYELITGEVPFATRPDQRGGWTETFQRILHEEPLRPSKRLTNATTSIADARGTNASTLVRETRGDADWIILKALAKRPTDRYESVAAMRRDVECLLSHHPIEAHPPSLLYQASKFVRRHCLVTCAAMLIVSAILVGVTGLVWGLQRARVAEANSTAALISEQRATRRATSAITAFADLIAEGCLAEPNSEEELLRQVIVLHDIASPPHQHTSAPSDLNGSVGGREEQNIDTLNRVLQILTHLRREQPTIAGEIVEGRVRHRLARTLTIAGLLSDGAAEYRHCISQFQTLCENNPGNVTLAQQLACLRVELSELLAVTSMRKFKGL